MSERHLFTSESVTEGHPDKVADQISDAILDAILTGDPRARVACETLVTTGLALVAGEITTRTYVDVPKVVRETVKEIGYTDAAIGFDYETCAVLTSIDEQSPDIAHGRRSRRRRRPGTHVRLRVRRDAGAHAAADPARAPDLPAARRAAPQRRAQVPAPRRQVAGDGRVRGRRGRSRSTRWSSRRSTRPRSRTRTLREAVIDEVIKPLVPRTLEISTRTRTTSTRPGASSAAGRRATRASPAARSSSTRTAARPPRRRRVQRQGPDEGRPHRRLHGALRREEPRRGRACVALRGASSPTRSASRSGLDRGRHIRDGQAFRGGARGDRSRASSSRRAASSSISICAGRSTGRRRPTDTSAAGSRFHLGAHRQGRRAPRGFAKTTTGARERA